MTLGFRILVPQPGLEPGDSAVKEWSLKPLDCQKIPFTSFLDLNFGSSLGDVFFQKVLLLFLLIAREQYRLEMNSVPLENLVSVGTLMLGFPPGNWARAVYQHRS